MDRPSGTVTFLFTDIQGSTRLWEQHPDSMRRALGRHDAMLREAIERNSGFVFRTVGDAFYAAFPTASDGVLAAVAAQESLAAEQWPSETVIRSRMAVVTGSAELRDDDYFGTPLNRAARLLTAGHGGQILVAASTRDLLHSRVPLVDVGLHRLKDLPQPEHIYLVDYQGMPVNLPPLNSLAISVRNLPQQLTAFVGRADDVVDWTDLIRERSRRLFTITGFGGIGKSRVAMRLGEELLFDFPDGVWWCSLEQATTVDDALARIASALGIVLPSSATVAEQVFRHLREQNALLILDNLEQISGGAGFLKQLLAETCQLVCLITSRRTMELRGESVLELTPMADRESFELFIERASECRSDFAVSNENRKDVMELCEKLEGVPLAIELAAARVAGMSPHQILQRLSERFRLLQSRSTEMNERQRALRGAIDWSYALLGDDEKQVFAQLSVFSGGFTLEDAEEVCEAFDVFESVMSLRQQSFFRTEGSSRAEAQRFIMLETLREYAAEKLGETGDQGKSVKQRHAVRVLRVAQECLKQLRTPDESMAMVKLGGNEKNIRAALEWARQNGDAGLSAELSLAAGSMLYRRGFWQSAAETLQAGLEDARSGPEASSLLTAQLLLERAGLHWDFKDEVNCQRLIQDSLPLIEAAGDLRLQGRAENLLGQTAMLGQRFDESIVHYEMARELFERANDHAGVANALNNLALAMRRNRGGSDAEIAERQRLAEARIHQTLEIRRRLGDRRGLAETLNNLGVLSFEMKKYEQAWSSYLESLEFELQVGDRHGIGISLANLGEVAGLLGRHRQGARLLAAGKITLSEVGSPNTGDAQVMLDDVAAAGSIEAEEINRCMQQARDLSTQDRCEWALSEAAD